MGVYIKGMGMPIDENETIIRIQPDGTVLDQYGHHLAITAVPVPPHGKLIDADEIIKFDHQHYEHLSDTFYVTVRDIELAPTIIPADTQWPEWRSQILGRPYSVDKECEE